MYAVIDKLRLIVIIDNSHSFGQSLIDLGYLFLYALNDLLGVFVDSFQDYSGHHFALSVLGDGALPEFVPQFNLRHVAHPNRSSAARIEHDVLDVLDVFDQAQSANDILFVAMLDKVCPGVLIVVLNCFEERFERDVVIDERLLIHDDVILLDVSTKAKHIGDAGHGSQL